MRKIMMAMAVSLDGYIEGAKGEYDWCFTDQDYGMSAFLGRVDAIFFGRKSYEVMMGAGNPGGPNPWAGMKYYVFSDSWKESGKDFELVTGDIKSRVGEIRNLAGKDIWLFGGASLTASLLSEDLVDELWLAVHPVLLGDGKPLLSGFGSRVTTELIECKTYSTGLVSLWYRVLKG